MQTLNGQVSSILNDIPGALHYCQNTSIPDDQNRLSRVIKPSGRFGGGQQQSTGFGQGSQSFGGFAAPARPGFGTASTLGGPKPAFGGPSPLGGGSTFGQSSAFGAGASTFGKPSGAATGFGSASTLGQQNNPFSSSQQKPSPFAQPAQTTGAFGTPAQQPTFGQSGLGAAVPKPAFGQAGPGFGGASAPAFGQAGSGFGNASKPAFGQSPFAQPAQQPAAGASPFGGAAGSGFGQPAAFGSNKPSPFAAASQPSSTGGFGQSSQQTASNASPFAQPAAARPNPFSAQPAQPAAHSPFSARPQAANTNVLSSPAFPTTPAGTAPTTWKGKRIVYPAKDKDRRIAPCYEVPDARYSSQGGIRLERIWFPTGPPPGPALTAEALPHVYEDATIGPQLKAVYEHVANTGTFKDGFIPEIPPKKEWVSFDI